MEHFVVLREEGRYNAFPILDPLPDGRLAIGCISSPVESWAICAGAVAGGTPKTTGSTRWRSGPRMAARPGPSPSRLRSRGIPTISCGCATAESSAPLATGANRWAYELSSARIGAIAGIWTAHTCSAMTPGPRPVRGQRKSGCSPALALRMWDIPSPPNWRTARSSPPTILRRRMPPPRWP